MNAKQVKKMRQIQRKMLPDIPAEVEAAIEKAFLTGVSVGWQKAVQRAGDEWKWGGLDDAVDA